MTFIILKNIYMFDYSNIKKEIKDYAESNGATKIVFTESLQDFCLEYSFNGNNYGGRICGHKFKNKIVRTFKKVIDENFAMNNKH